MEQWEDDVRVGNWVLDVASHPDITNLLNKKYSNIKCSFIKLHFPKHGKYKTFITSEVNSNP